MSTTLDSRGIKLFDYATEFAQPFREAIRARAERVAGEEGIEIEYIKKPKGFRKEDRIREIVAKRGDHPGLVHVFSVMELCSSYRPWHNKQTGMNYLRPDGGKCVYYFYFIDEVLGLCFLSVPTWCPFRAQFYFNGHNWLASKLAKAHVSYELRDNAFARISDWQKAQDVSDSLTVTEIHARMDAAVARYVPDLAPLGRYHWSIAQAEYATDIVFRSADDLAPLYDHLLRTAIQAVKFSDIATFLGRSPDQPGNQQIGGDFSIRIHGTRVRHYLGPASIKMYDKHGFILRVDHDQRRDLFPTPPDGGTARRQASHETCLPQEVHLLTLSRSAIDLPRSKRPLHPVPLHHRRSNSRHQGTLQDLRLGPRARTPLSRLQLLRR
jgi:hypothetical protein